MLGESQKKNWIPKKKSYTNNQTWRRSRNGLGLYGYAGVGELAIVEGIMNAKGYVNILRGNLMMSIRKLVIQDSYLFQQDNNLKHKVRITREWLLYNARGLLETPPQSPDINPIENLWSLLEKRKQEIQMFVKTNAH
jgi:transposase